MAVQVQALLARMGKVSILPFLCCCLATFFATRIYSQTTSSPPPTTPRRLEIHCFNPEDGGNILTPSWEADQFSQLTKKFPAFYGIYGTRRLFTVLTSAHHLSLSWANSIQSPRPPPTSWRPILILSSHLSQKYRCQLLPKLRQNTEDYDETGELPQNFRSESAINLCRMMFRWLVHRVVPSNCTCVASLISVTWRLWRCLFEFRNTKYV
jgi:hypothetical protein